MNGLDVHATRWSVKGGVVGAAAGLLAISLLAAGCTSGSAGSPSAPTSVAAATRAATPAATRAATVAAASSAPPSLLAPLPATLEAAGSGPLPGELGTFTWDGSGSDSPWIVPPTGPAVGAGKAVDIALTGPTPTSWTAAWAPISAAPGTTGTAGQASPAGSGSGGAPVQLRAPAASGAWGLRLDVVYGVGREAMWFWRVEVGP